MALRATSPCILFARKAEKLHYNKDGIFAASSFLRHRDIAVTAAHYADKKTRTAVDVGALLKANEGEAENIIPLRKAL